MKRNFIRLLSVVCATTSTGPVPSMPPGALASAVSSVIGWLTTFLSVIGLITRFRMYWNVQPVSSYGRGFAGAKLWTEKYMSAIVRYG